MQKEREQERAKSQENVKVRSVVALQAAPTTPTGGGGGKRKRGGDWNADDSCGEHWGDELQGGSSWYQEGRW